MLKNIDFSKGIKDVEIKENFNDIQKQTNIERLSVGGKGILSGLNIYLNNNNLLHVDQGELIDIFGNLLEMNDTDIEIKDIDLFKNIEGNSDNNKLISDNKGNIILSKIPYSLSKDSIAFLETNENLKGIKIVPFGTDISDENNKSLSFSFINANTIQVDQKYSNTALIVEYWYSAPRYDVLYIDIDDDNIPTYKILTGISSDSSFIPTPNRYNCIIASIYINPYYLYTNLNEEQSYKINIDINKIVAMRNIFNDSNNNLYINGQNINNIRFVYITKPDDPKEGSLWYDDDENELKIWKVPDDTDLDSGYWNIINDHSTMSVSEKKIWSPQDCPADLQTFIFSNDEKNLMFTPGTNCVEVIIGNKIVMSDQFTEIINQSTDITSMSGIGIKLANPLSNPDYVQVIIKHNVAQADINKIYQKSTTIIHSEDFRVNNDLKTIYNTKITYQIGYEQLEVFLNGVRLSKSYIAEGTDLSVKEDGAVSKQFGVLTNVKENDIVSYKISKNVFSYTALDDWITSIINTYKEEQDAKISTINNNITDIKSNINILNNYMNTHNFFSCYKYTTTKQHDQYINNDIQFGSAFIILNKSTNEILQCGQEDVYNKDYVVSKTDSNGIRIDFTDNIYKDVQVYIIVFNM